MIRAALSELNALVENRQDKAAAPAMEPAKLSAQNSGPDDASIEGARSLQGKLENAFVSDMPPRIFHSGFDSAAQQQAAAFHDLSNRVERMESAELADMRNAMRELCEAMSGLALETERGTRQSEEKFKAFSESLEAELASDRERLDAIDAGHAKARGEIRQSLAQLEDRLVAMDARGETLARTVDALKSEILTDVNVALAKHRTELGEAQKAIVALKDYGLRAADRIAALDTRSDELARSLETARDELTGSMSALKDEIAHDTANALSGHRSRLEQTERAVALIQEQDSKTAERLTALDARGEDLTRRTDGMNEKIVRLQDDGTKAAERLTALDAQGVEQTRRIEGMNEEIAGLQDYDNQTTEQADILQTYTENLSREFDVAKAELVELHETAAVVEAHQRVLEQVEAGFAELKDRQTRSTMRIESLGGRHEELVGEVRLVRADLSETAGVLRAHQKEMTEQTERAVADLRDRQTQSAARIEAADGRQGDLASELRLTRTDLAENVAVTTAQQTMLEQGEKNLTELKDRQTRSALRMDAMDGRHDALVGDIRQVKADLEKNGMVVTGHQAGLEQAEKVLAELKDRQTRAALRIDAMDGRQNEQAGDLRLTKTALSETADIVKTHQVVLEQNEKSIIDLKDNHVRAASRIDALDGRQEELTGDLRATRGDALATADTVEAQQALLKQAERNIGELKDRQTQSVLRIELLNTRQEEQANGLRLSQTDLQETTAMVQAHQGLLEQNDKNILELKDRQTRSAARIDVMDGRQEELAGDLRLTRSEAQRTQDAVEVQQASLKQAEKTIGELKDRQTQSVLRIDLLNTRQEEQGSDLRLTRTDLQETGAMVQAHQGLLEQADKNFIEIKERQSRAGLRADATDGRQEELLKDMGVVKAGLSALNDTPNQLRAHQVALIEADKAVAELKDRQTRAGVRIEALDSRQTVFSGEISTVKAGLSALSDTPNQLRSHQTALDEADKAIAELRERGARALARIEGMDTRQDGLSDEISVMKAGLGALSDTPNQLRGHQALLEDADKSIAELRERQIRSASRIDVMDSRQDEMSGEIATVKTGLSALGETPNQLRGHQALLDETEKAITELKDRSARSASRIEAVAAGLGDLSGKLDVQSEGARGMHERLREAERALAQAQERERALAQLHARAADALRGTEEA